MRGRRWFYAVKGLCGGRKGECLWADGVVALVRYKLQWYESFINAPHISGELGFVVELSLFFGRRECNVANFSEREYSREPAWGVVPFCVREPLFGGVQSEVLFECGIP